MVRKDYLKPEELHLTTASKQLDQACHDTLDTIPVIYNSVKSILELLFVRIFLVFLLLSYSQTSTGLLTGKFSNCFLEIFWGFAERIKAWRTLCRSFKVVSSVFLISPSLKPHKLFES